MCFLCSVFLKKYIYTHTPTHIYTVLVIMYCIVRVLVFAFVTDMFILCNTPFLHLSKK